MSMTIHEDPNFPTALVILAEVLIARFTQIQNLHDLEVAIELYEATLQWQSLEKDTLSEILLLLSQALALHFQHSEDTADLDRQIDCHRKGLQLAPSHNSLLTAHKNGFVDAVMNRRLHAKEDENYRIPLTELQAILPREHELQEHLENASRMGALLESLSALSLSELDQAIEDQTERLEGYGENHNIPVWSLSGLATLHYTRFQLSNQMEDVERSLSYSREALGRSSPEDSYYLRALDLITSALLYRLKIAANPADQQEAISCAQLFLDSLPPTSPSPERVRALMRLSDLLQYRFEQSGDTADLNNVVTHLKNAVELGRSCSTNELVESLNKLAISLSNLFMQVGNIVDCDDSVSYYRQLIDLLPSGHPARAKSQVELGYVLELRASVLDDHAGRSEIVHSYTELLAAMKSTDETYLEILLFLALVLINQSSTNREPSIQDLKTAEGYLREAIDICPEPHEIRTRILAILSCSDSCHPDWLIKAAYDKNLAGLLLQYSGIGVVKPQERATPMQQLVDAIQFRRRFEISGDPADEEEVVARYLQAGAEFPESHFAQAAISLTLAQHYLQSGRSEENNLDKAFFYLERAVNMPGVEFKQRVSLAIEWANRARSSSHGSALRAYTLALSLFDRLAIISPTVESKHEELSKEKLRFIATSAASCAIDCGRLETAVELLDQGRAIIWSQASRYRAPLDHLETEDSELAKEFRGLSILLERNAVSANTLLSRAAEEHRFLTSQWEGLVERIRAKDGFSDFLRTTPFTTLQIAAANGPVIVINIDTHRSDAIILRASYPPILVPLPKADMEAVLLVLIDFLKARFKEIEGSKAKSMKIKNVLRELWNIIIQPVVEELQGKCNLPLNSRVWWCPTGYLWYLPLHAAGPYQPSERNLPDIFVSSYTPTLAALLRSINSHVDSSPRNSPSVLLVGQTQTPGQKPLPNVDEELNEVARLIPSTIRLDGQDATRDAVLDGLRRCSWVHLSCHGHQDLHAPFKSHFSLHDGHLTLLDIVQTRLPHELAFLSACNSAEGDRSTLNEAIHLAAGLQFSGYAGVVGTLWDMVDIDAPDMAREFYGHMVRNSGDGLNYRNAAAALNHATREMRKRGVPIDRWINFVHIGA